MNKTELVTAMAEKAGVTKADAEKVLTAFIDTVENTVKNGDAVQLVGFGTFERKARAAREGRNPQTGATIKIEACNVPSFKAGKAFKELVK